jgi:hypothetical protein
MYADAVDDQTLKAKLGTWAAAKADQLERERQLERLRAQIQRTQAVDLADLEAETHIGVALFEPRQISQAHRESSIPPARTITLRLIDPSRGYAEVISDTALTPPTGGLFAPHTRGSIGARIVEHGREWLEPRLHVHAPLGYDVGDGVRSTPEVIGYAEIAGGLLLLDAAVRAR